ncbi:hypothetical protein Desku_2502 [Desulfofundulus kuznetsovii DSM 6115]|uniref:Uncharacterized protein n=1 Tax=Desulfofundulus kuznetsovii (strain DSM 6115 / VKM B-1805 / 17) TaxID=760568 RepID=A0AAU8PXT8_DESK7|nr:hypothetical protein Desku_2502 [Desulfofundulus kuznetsovii DSM 6115]
MKRAHNYVISVRFVPVPGWERRYEEGMAAFLKMLQYARNASGGSIPVEKRQEDQCLRGSSERPTR